MASAPMNERIAAIRPPATPTSARDVARRADARPRLSVVIPVYNEVENLREMVDRVEAALAPLRVDDRPGRTFELILVDDGSSDGTAPLLDDVAATRPWLVPLHLIRNYGQSTALQAGFDHARGEFIATLDGDLQNDPGDIPMLLERLESDPSIDAISGWRRDRQDKTLSRKLPSWLANALISRVTGVRLHDYGCALKVYRFRIIENLRLYGEMHRFIPALAAEAGAKLIEVPVRHHARKAGRSKYGIDRTLRVALDLVWVKFTMRFLHRPLHAFGAAGFGLMLPGLAVLAYLSFDKLVLGNPIGTRPLLLLGALMVLAGVQLLGVGVLGELITRVWHEPQGRRQYVLRPSSRDGDAPDA